MISRADRALALLVPALLVLVAAGPHHRREMYGPPAPPPPPTPYDQCDAAFVVARVPAVPATLLPAIGRVESGRLDPATQRVRSWPWTINVEGVGHFYDTKEAAIAAVQGYQSHGVRSIDVGCMQVNLMYHPDAFPNLDTAFDPAANAAYAVRFLLTLFAMTKNWNLATAYYHSATQDRGEDYQRRVFGRVMTPMGPPSLGGKGALFLPPSTVFGAIPPSASMFGAIPPSALMFGAFAPPTGATRPTRR